MPLFSLFRALCRGESSVIGEDSATRSTRPPPPPPQLEARGSVTPASNGISLTRQYAQIAQDLRSSLPPTCRWLGPGDVDHIGEHPVGAGGSADIYEATHGSRRVVLKRYRCYILSDITQIVAVRCDCSLC